MFCSLNGSVHELLRYLYLIYFELTELIMNVINDLLFGIARERHFEGVITFC